MEDPQFVKKFRHAERPGVYCRVIESGYVATNDRLTLLPYQGPAVSVLEMFRGFYEKPATVDELRRLLAVPIPEKARASLEERLEQVLRT
jgi:MOSC domain-containing protein YiiM